MSTQTRIRYFPNDSPVFDAGSAKRENEDDTFENEDHFEQKHEKMRRLRRLYLAILSHDELHLDLALHRVLEVSNRSSAEQFQIAASQASRKGKKAFHLLETGGLGIIFAANIRRYGFSVCHAGQPPRILAPDSQAFFIPLPKFSTTLPSIFDWSDAAKFIRRHWKTIQASTGCPEAESSSIAIGGWNRLGKTSIHLGIVSRSQVEAQQIGRRLKSALVFDCQQRCPLGQ